MNRTMKHCEFILCLLCLSFNIRVFCESVERVGNPDDTARIERPCPTYDLNCIRTFFQQHGDCRKTFGPVPDPISEPQASLYMPRANLSLSIVDQRISGLNGRIEEFYLNRETDKLVIAVEFRNMSQSSDKIYFKSHRRAREPVITLASYTLFYDPLIITAVIPKIDNLQLQDAECTTYATSLTARFVISPTAIESTDLQPELSIGGALTNVGEDIQEVFLTDSAYFIATYIQYNIYDKARIERPCPTYDLNCIRTFFQSHSQCKKTFGPVPEPLSRPQFIFYLPRSNLSVIIVDVRIRGLNGKIEEFYINRETDNLVIAVEFSSITQTSDKIYFKANRRGREPVVTVSSYVLFLNPMIITAVIPKIDDLQLQDAECTTYSTSRTASFAITPSALESTDLQPDLSIVSALTNLGEDIQELYLTDSAYSIATYIQYNICDFGLLLT